MTHSITKTLIRGTGMGGAAIFILLQNRLGLVRATALTFIALPLLLTVLLPVVALLGFPILFGAMTQSVVERWVHV